MLEIILPDSVSTFSGILNISAFSLHCMVLTYTTSSKHHAISDCRINAREKLGKLHYYSAYKEVPLNRHHNCFYQ